MTADLPVFVPHLLAFGLSGIFLVALFEKLVPVVPSFAVYLSIGAVSGGDLSLLIPLALTTACASTIGSLCWFLVSRTQPVIGLAAWLTAWARKRIGTRRRLSSGRSGTMIAVQLVPVVRIYSSVVFGAGGAVPCRFIAATFAGCLVWNSALIAIGAAIAATPWRNI